MPRFSRLLCFTVMAALAVALAACGRKGPLDPPPGAAMQPGARAQADAGAAGVPPGVQADDGADGRPLAPRGQKKTLPIDWLID